MSPPTLSADKAAYLATSDGSPVPLLGVSVSARVFGALEECHRSGIDSTHAVYGAQVKKAVEALCALSRTLASSAADLERALEVAARVASGRRLQAAVSAALAAVRAARAR